MVQKMGGKIVEMFSDSRLVVGQVKGELKARDARMQEYLGQVRCIQIKFEFYDLYACMNSVHIMMGQI